MFTVVIPLFEKRAYLQRALDSVYAQAIEPAVVPEIVVVNDGSTDGGDAVARAQADPRVRVIDQPNRGVSAARNAGIAAAGQPFVAFLDADDRWRPEFLARMRDLIARHPGGALYGSGFVTLRDGREASRHGALPREIGGDPTCGGPVDSFASRARDTVFNSSSIVVPKAAALEVGGFPDGVAHGEDHMFWDRLALHGPVVLSPEPLAEYDTSVPGQAIEFWNGDYRRRFEILAHHRFLADELRRRATSGAGPASFIGHARRHLRTAVLQRFYWGNFVAVDRLWRELRLDGLGLGAAAAMAAWVARRRVVQPLAGAALGVIRGVRSFTRPATRPS
ncbi:MAG: glycosyltransferase family 2 protein [Planctomycetaceae bacterium]